MPIPTRLVIGNKNYSSWSLRAWLVARHAGLDFEEVPILLGQQDSRERILALSPSGRVPCLIDDDIVVWETSSIAEYLAEKFPDKLLWPADRAARTHARSVSSEMHAGFATLRAGLPMNARRSSPGKVRNGIDQELLDRDIRRIIDIWCEARERFGSRAADDAGFLYGQFSIADAMFAPVVLRFRTYDVSVPEPATAYMGKVLADAHLRMWISDSEQEQATMPEKDL